MKLVGAIPTNTTGQAVARQLIRAGTSVGANVEEAQGSHSKRDFAKKMNIARSEAREVLYWLKLIKETGLLPGEQLVEIIKEADEIVRILTTIVKRTKRD